MPKRRTQAERREEAESRMISAAIKLMAETGYHGFSLADVGEAAGYSRGLPTHYFGRKEELLAVVARSIVSAFNWATTRLLPSERGLPRIATWIRQYARATGSKDSIVLGMLVTEASVRPDLRRTILELDAKALADLRQELEAGMEAGNIRSDLDTQLEAKSIFCFMRGLITFSAHDPSFNAPAVAERYIATLTNGIAKKKPS